MTTTRLALILVLCAGCVLAQKPRKPKGPRIHKPKISDARKAAIYADNWFKLYINGNLVAVDSISFIPHNVVAVDILPEYPMTIAVMARDNADPKTGMEYNNTNIGDGGFILRFSDGTVTDASWKALSVSRGPLDGGVVNTPIPQGWGEPGFDDSAWPQASVFSEDDVGPSPPFTSTTSGVRVSSGTRA
ncbi:MAG: hypothetical protein ACI8W8_001319 [Rhodothermales bacterium]|jgi:hypothetical protein